MENFNNGQIGILNEVVKPSLVYRKLIRTTTTTTSGAAATYCFPRTGALTYQRPHPSTVWWVPSEKPVLQEVVGRTIGVGGITNLSI